MRKLFLTIGQHTVSGRLDGYISSAFLYKPSRKISKQEISVD